MYPSKPIHIIAFSNGCRIGSWIETRLRNLDIKIKLTCVAGAYGGSILIDKFKIPLKLFLDKDIICELSTKSNVNDNLKKMINEPVNIGKRFYEFYGTTCDLYIPNFNDCFPIITNTNQNLTVIYHEIKNHYGHGSLGWYLKEEIIENSLKWFNDEQ